MKLRQNQKYGDMNCMKFYALYVMLIVLLCLVDFSAV